jgi:hypothetical protein
VNVDHEFVLDQEDKILEHKAVMEKFPEMEHDDPNPSGWRRAKSGEIIWKFTNDGEFKFACLDSRALRSRYARRRHGRQVMNHFQGDTTMKSASSSLPRRLLLSASLLAYRRVRRGVHQGHRQENRRQGKEGHHQA